LLSPNPAKAPTLAIRHSMLRRKIDKPHREAATGTGRRISRFCLNVHRGKRIGETQCASNCRSIHGSFWSIPQLTDLLWRLFTTLNLPLKLSETGATNRPRVFGSVPAWWSNRSLNGWEGIGIPSTGYNQR
jgi:hypothetical protein